MRLQSVQGNKYSTRKAILSLKPLQSLSIEALENRIKGKG